MFHSLPGFRFTLFGGLTALVMVFFPQPLLGQATNPNSANQTSADHSSAVVAEIKAQEVNLYADAHPYMDESLTKLKKRVRQLGGLKPEENQEQRPRGLSKSGKSDAPSLKNAHQIILYLQRK